MLEVDKVTVNELGSKSDKVNSIVDAFKSPELDLNDISIPEISLALSGFIKPKIDPVIDEY